MLRDYILSTDAERWRNLGIAAVPDRIKKGGRRVVSIDAKHREEKIADLEPGFARQFDWELFAAQIGLTAVETVVFMLCWRDRFPASHLAAKLHVKPHAAAKAYASVRTKIGIGSALAARCSWLEPLRNSSKPVYRDRLPAGMRPWALARLDENFIEIMNREKYIGLISQQPAKIIPKSARIWPGINREVFVNQNELEQKLRAERLKFDRLAIRGGEIRDFVDQAVTKVTDLRVALKNETEEAILNERQPDERLRKRVEASEAELTRARELSVAHGGAMQRQREIIEGIEAQIAAGAREAVLTLIGPKMARVAALQNELMILHREVNGDCAGVYYLQPTDFFPGTTVYNEAAWRMMNFRSAGQLRDYLSGWTNSPFYIEREHIGAGFFAEKRSA